MLQIGFFVGADRCVRPREPVFVHAERLDKIPTFNEWMEYVSKNTSPTTVSEDWVVTDTLLAIEDNRIVGIISLRHNLNDFLKDFKSENDKLNLEIEVHDLKTLKVNTRCKLLIDNNEISTIDTENGLAEYKMDITDITNGEHVLELHINETSNTKSAIIKKKFIK